MNINDAKRYIKESIAVYLKKDEYGGYKIPLNKQRPIFLVGAPGIGKTAIIEQIAQELDVALVSYSMTHHTRQSAIGLPVVKNKIYDGSEYEITEYTMSEIISEIYNTIEKSGIKEGILFLDEINCVSETLAPSMLLFLQYKIFGKHKIPEGWIVVTAGNPPEYNKSVREFDVATMDRLKVIEVEPDYSTWKQFATDKGIHGAILSFLDIKKDYFYYMDNSAKGKLYATARGWDDLSEIIFMYEGEGYKVDENLISQYIRHDLIVKEFSVYYDLYNKYKKDYQVDDILKGNITIIAVNKAKAAEFDERLSLVGLLLEQVLNKMKAVILFSEYLNELMPALENVKTANSVYSMLDKLISDYRKNIENKSNANSISYEQKNQNNRVIMYLADIKTKLLNEQIDDNDRAFKFIKKDFANEVANMKELASNASEKLRNMFKFVHEAFEDGNEMLVLLTELTNNKYSSKYIAMFGSDEYHKYNELLMISDREDALSAELDKIDVE